MPLEGLVGAFPTTRDRFFLAYAESVSAVDDDRRRPRSDALVGLIRSYADGVSDDEAFTAALGMDMAAFEQSWLDGARGGRAGPHGPQPAPGGPLPEGWSARRPERDAPARRHAPRHVEHERPDRRVDRARAGTQSAVLSPGSHCSLVGVAIAIGAISSAQVPPAPPRPRRRLPAHLSRRTRRRQAATGPTPVRLPRSVEPPDVTLPAADDPRAPAPSTRRPMGSPSAAASPPPDAAEPRPPAPPQP